MFIAIEADQRIIRVGCSYLGHEIEALVRFKTPAQPAKFASMLASAVHKLTNGAPVDGIGVAIHGNLDSTRQHATRLGHTSLPATFLGQKVLSQAFSCPVVMAQAVQLAGFIEYRYGAGTKTNRQLYIEFGDNISHSYIQHSNHLADQQTNTGAVLIPEHNKLVTLNDWVGAIGLEAEFGAPIASHGSTQVWQIIARRMAITIHNLEAVYQPTATVIGGTILLTNPNVYLLTKKELARLRHGQTTTALRRATYNQLGSLLGALWLIHQ